MPKSESSSKKHNLQLTDVFIKVCFFVFLKILFV